jgi:hypothetical protein
MLPVWGKVLHCAPFGVPDQALAEHHAAWLADKFVWDQHPGKQSSKLDPVAGISRNEVIGAGAAALFLRQHPPADTTAEHKDDAREASAVAHLAA